MITTALVLASLALQQPQLQLQAELRPDAPKPTTPAAAVATLKAHYFAQDYEGAVGAWPDLQRFARTPEVRAWYVVNLARIRAAEALAVVDSAALWSDPSSPWRTFARSFATYYQRDGNTKALELAREFRKTAPWSQDAIWLQMYTLHGAGKYKEVAAVADSVLARGIKPWGNLLSVKANALGAIRDSAGDSTNRKAALAAFAEARRIEPTHVNAHFLPAFNLSGGPTDTVTLTLMHQASRLTPAINVHRSYWTGIRNRRDIAVGAKDSIIGADVELLLTMRPNNPAVLRAAHDAFIGLKRHDRAVQLANRIRTEFADTEEREQLDYTGLQALNDSIFRRSIDDTAAGRQRFLAGIKALSARPIKQQGIRGQMLSWQYVYFVEKDSSISGDSLVRFANALHKANPGHPLVYNSIARQVAERKGDFRWAERRILEGDSIQREQLTRMKDFFVKQEGVGKYADMVDGVTANKHASIAWVYMHEGRLADAEKELNKALELQRRSATVHYNFGRLAELRGQPAQAQAAYARGYPLESSFSTRRNKEALERIYRTNNGSLDGFDVFLEKLKAEDRERRKTKIAGERLTNGAEFASFALERYGSPTREKLSSDVLKGKIGVVNFWGVWCGPCVMEIDDIQRFHVAVKNDPDVVFLTVDYNDPIERLQEFMTQRKLDFPVILDADRWASDKAKVDAYPTTFFIGRDGKIAFKHVGASDVVLEEFLWRVEMLKAGPKP